MLVSTSNALLLILLLAAVQWTTIAVANSEGERGYGLVLSPPDASSQGNFSVVLPSNATKLRGTYHDCELRNFKPEEKESPLQTFAGLNALHRLQSMRTSVSAHGTDRPLLETHIYPMWKSISLQYQIFRFIAPPLLHRILQGYVLLPKEATDLMQPLSNALHEQGTSLENCISDAEEAATGAKDPQTAETARRHSAESCFQGLVSNVRASILSGINANGTMEHPEVTLPFFQLWVADYVMLSLAELNQQMFPSVADCDGPEPDDSCEEKLHSLLQGVQSFAASLRRHVKAVQRALVTMKEFNEDIWKRATTIASHPVEVKRTKSCVHMQVSSRENVTMCKTDEAAGEQLSCGTDFSEKQSCEVAVSDHSVESETAAGLCLAVLGGITYYHDEAARRMVAEVYERDMEPFVKTLIETGTLMEHLESKVKAMVEKPSEPLQ